MYLCVLLQVRPFYEKRMGQEVDAETLGDEFKGYVVRITGGNDKQGFPMKQGVLTGMTTCKSPFLTWFLLCRMNMV